MHIVAYIPICSHLKAYKQQLVSQTRADSLLLLLKKQLAFLILIAAVVLVDNVHLSAVDNVHLAHFAMSFSGLHSAKRRRKEISRMNIRRFQAD